MESAGIFVESSLYWIESVCSELAQSRKIKVEQTQVKTNIEKLVPKKEARSSLTTTLNQKAVKILADSIFEQLKNEGCEAKDIISVSSQLLSLVTDQLQHDSN